MYTFAFSQGFKLSCQLTCDTNTYCNRMACKTYCRGCVENLLSRTFDVYLANHYSRLVGK